MTTQKRFIENTNIPEALVKAVVRQSGGWQSFRESAPDITSHGADGGFSGFIYYSDTVPFTKRNRAAIQTYGTEMARDIGAGSFYSLVSGFRCIDLTPEQVAEAFHDPKAENRDEVFNALAWFALEEVARAYCDMIER